MSDARRKEALRRLGGPVCPVCTAVDVEQIEVRWVGGFGEEWLRTRGKGSVIKESLAPMCQKCFLQMNNDEVARKTAEMERAARRQVQLAKEAEWMVRYQDPQRGRMYRAAVAEHQGDLAAAEDLAAAWDVGNGLFGRRGD